MGLGKVPRGLRGGDPVAVGFVCKRLLGKYELLQSSLRWPEYRFARFPISLVTEIMSSFMRPSSSSIAASEACIDSVGAGFVAFCVVLPPSGAASLELRAGVGKRHSSTRDDRLIDDDEEELEPISTPTNASDFGSCIRPTNINEEESIDTVRKRINKGKARLRGEKHAIRLNIGSLVEETRSVGLAIREATNPSNQAYIIAEVVKELNKHEDIVGYHFLYDFTTVFMLQKSNREMFLCLDEEKRVWWLKNRYQCMTEQMGPC
ncbi:hypothetical protein KSP39_PZI005175 [Platanthera zijinensis]|uniref:Uncharacterized protein n=1 Tax=Platanthera zijinensis TaxID=2320716 RepID=A0AAP0BR35_9ASPA